MKKVFVFSIAFSLSFLLFPQAGEKINNFSQNEDVVTKEKDNKEEDNIENIDVKKTDDIIPWEEIIESELLQDVIIDSTQEKNETNITSTEEGNLINSEIKTEEETVSDDTESLHAEKIEHSEIMLEPSSECNEDGNNEEQEENEENIEQTIQKIPLSIASEEILSRPDVEKFRQQYLSPKWSALLYSYLESAMEYRLYVRQQIQKRNLPEVLEYLPIVESNYKTSAKSYSGAVGMWQFMANSVYPFLTLNDFVDQRLDPWYSTDAGLSKLEDNYNYFGDWLIAIAAYNCGGGAMTKAIKNAGVKDFWYLADNGYLPKQTADYIPKLLAIADLAINSEYYGIDLPNHNEEFELLENEKNGVFDYITVHKAYSISDLAKELRIEQSTMEKLNASYILGITHPTKESKIRLPPGLGPSAESAIEKLTPIDYPFKYKVVSGDSLWSISRKYNVTVNEICELNNIKENDILSIGKVLYIPSK